MRGPPNIRIAIIIKLLQSFIHLLLEPGRTAITNDVQHSRPDSVVLVLCHLEDSLPEFVDVLQDLTWAELLAGLETDVGVLVVGVLEDLFDVFGVFTDVDQLLLVFDGARLGEFFLVLFTLWHLICRMFCLVFDAINYRVYFV